LIEDNLVIELAKTFVTKATSSFLSTIVFLSISVSCCPIVGMLVTGYPNDICDIIIGSSVENRFFV
jgi:hypothetical protein